MKRTPRRVVITCGLLLALVSAGSARGASDDVCDFFASVLKTGDLRALERLSPQENIGPYHADAPPPPGWRYPTSRTFSELTGPNDWLVSLVDINNDGIPDVRFTKHEGTAGCEYTNFYTPQPDGTYTALLSVSGEASICMGDSVVVVRHRQMNYLVAYHDRFILVDLLTPDRPRQKLCHLTRTSGPLRVKSVCRDAVCRAVERTLRDWESNLSESAITAPESDPALVKTVDVDSVTIRDRDFTARDVQLVDIDNDGRPELVWQTWEGPRWGIVALIFGQRGGAYERVKEETRWPGWPARAEEGLFFIRVRGKTYTVALTRPYDNPRRRRIARIFLVTSKAAREIGAVEWMSDRVVTIERR